MQATDVLGDAFGRVREGVRTIAEGLDAEALAWRPAPSANPVGWLLWHLTRVQDDHVSAVMGELQRWTDQGWFDRFGLALDPRDIGYGHTTEQVARVRIGDPWLLVGYHEAVADRTLGFLASLEPDDLDRVVDESWDPPVTLGVRLTSVVDDCLQHVGQAAYVRGLIADRGS
ncbi:MAG TPA: DUF664 domain-containing protein [Acidimicrobiales bacterium]|nr:DUF664 domain-containing protein [Acidimicrobiales bacterium]